MKTIKLSTQLLILFTTVTILSAVVFGLVTFKNYESIYYGIAQSELKTYSKTITRDIQFDNEIDDSYEYMAYVIVEREEAGTLSYDVTLTFSEHFLAFETDIDIFDRMIHDIILNNKESYDSAASKVHYLLSKNVVLDDKYVVGIMHEAHIDLIKKESRQSDILLSFLGTFISFAVIIVVGNIILALWSREITKRINKLTAEVSMLGSTGYEKEIEITGSDELSALSVQIENMRHEIRYNESTKQEMFQNISHDFKTPISVIKSYAEAIEDGIATVDDAKIIIEQSDKLQDKVTKLLEYTKLEYIDSSIPLEDVNLKEVIIDVVETYRILLSEFKLKLDLEEAIFKGFRENYVTVISNILDNALRYAQTTIVITLRHDVLTIYNDGIPIEDKYIQELFKPYEKGTRGQFGLGMSIVQKTVNRFGYRLKVENIDKGVMFTILP